MKKHTFAIVGLFCLLSGQAAAQFLGRGLGYLDRDNPLEYTVLGMWSNALARGPYPVQDPAPLINAVNGGYRDSHARSGDSYANTELETYLEGQQPTENYSVSLWSEASANVHSLFWTPQRYGEARQVVNYVVRLPEDADFGIMTVQVKVDLASGNSMTGGGEAFVMNYDSGSTVMVSLQGLPQVFTANGRNLTYDPVAQFISETSTFFPVDTSGVTATTVNASQTVTGYILVYEDDLIVASANTFVDGRNNTPQANFFVEGLMHSKAEVEILEVKGYQWLLGSGWMPFPLDSFPF